MSAYAARFTGEITITPSLSWQELKVSPGLTDLRIRINEDVTETPLGQNRVLTGVAITAAHDFEYGGYGMEAVTRRCRHCSEEIKPSTIPGFWWGSDGTHWCAANKVDSAIHEPGCPDSAVVDQIVPWPEVGEGDLILWSETFQPVLSVDRDRYREYGRIVFTVGAPGYEVVRLEDGPEHVAVRRYVTEEAPDA